MGLFTRRPRSTRTNFTVVSILMVVVGTVLTFMSLRSLNYKQAEGVIIRSEVTGSGKSRKVTVQYVYTVNDMQYDNDTVSYSLTMFRNTAKLLNQYPVGRRVPVHYSITDPSYSVLEKGFSFGSLGMVVAGIGLFAGLRLFGH